MYSAGSDSPPHQDKVQVPHPRASTTVKQLNGCGLPQKEGGGGKRGDIEALNRSAHYNLNTENCSHYMQINLDGTDQGCALAAPGRLRRLTFGLGRLKKKSGRPSGRIDFGLCENPKRNQQTYRNGTERYKKKLHRAPRLPLARKAKALKAQCNQ